MSTINTYENIFQLSKLKDKFNELDDTIFVAEASLTAAEIKALNTTPIEVVAAPGAGKVLELVGATLIFDYGTTQMAAGGAVVLEEETSGTDLSSTVADTVIQAAADSINTMIPVAAAVTANKGIFITNATADFTTGDSVARVKVAYRVHSTGL